MINDSLSLTIKIFIESLISVQFLRDSHSIRVCLVISDEAFFHSELKSPVKEVKLRVDDEDYLVPSPHAYVEVVGDATSQSKKYQLYTCELSTCVLLRVWSVKLIWIGNFFTIYKKSAMTRKNS